VRLLLAVRRTNDPQQMLEDLDRSRPAAAHAVAATAGVPEGDVAARESRRREDLDVSRSLPPRRTAPADPGGTFRLTSVVYGVVGGRSRALTSWCASRASAARPSSIGSARCPVARPSRSPRASRPAKRPTFLSAAAARARPRNGRPDCLGAHRPGSPRGSGCRRTHARPATRPPPATANRRCG